MGAFGAIPGIAPTAGAGAEGGGTGCPGRAAVGCSSSGAEGLSKVRGSPAVRDGQPEITDANP